MRFACEHCGASLALAGVRTQVCPYCASPAFVERPAVAAPGDRRVDPRFVVPFAGDAAWAGERLRHWLGRRWLYADPAVARASVERLRGIYLPTYAYSAVARTEFTAQIGEHYTETETRKVQVEIGIDDGHELGGQRDRPGHRTEHRTVTRTEYRPLAGEHVGYVTDVVVSASVGVDDRTLARIAPFDLGRLRRYSPALVVGWIEEEFSRDAEACTRSSRAQAIDTVGDELRQFLPGDGHADLAWTTKVEWESVEPILVPVWVLAVRYRDDRPALRVVINGQTGKVTGAVPIAWWKIALWVLLAGAIAAAIVLATRGGAP